MKPDSVIKTDYGTLTIYQSGRSIQWDINPNIKAPEHHNALRRYVEKLHDEGIENINCDHVTYPWINKQLPLARGNRRLDIVYYDRGRIFEVELKPARDVGINRTYVQLKEMMQHCENLIFLVPTSHKQVAEENIRLMKLNRVTVDTYD